MTSRSLEQKAASLLLYQSVLAGDIGRSLLQLLEQLQNGEGNRLSCLRAYGRWFQAIAATGQSWPDYLVARILDDDNPFAQALQRHELSELPPALLDAARHDLSALQSFYQCSGQQLGKWVQSACQMHEPPVVWGMPARGTGLLHQSDRWEEELASLAEYYRRNGVGIFGRFRALSWQRGQLTGIAHPDPVQLHEMAGYEWQREALVKNTEFLLAGYRALHVLLYGSRGSGKSSLVKALLNKFADRGLRLVEVSKSELAALPEIVEQLRSVPQKFMIFVDDLSFEDDDDAFKALKVVLEGSVTARAQNTVVYATSNRRHLIREFFDDRPRPSDKDEIHAWDTMQEKLSFSDRFGLTLTFEPADQETYLKIVRHLASGAEIDLAPEDLEFRARQWATRHNGRSGRSARQFVDHLRAELALFPE